MFFWYLAKHDMAWATWVLHKGKFVYCATGSGQQLVAFSTEDSQVEHTLSLGINAGDGGGSGGMNDTIGIAHHPHVNLVASFSKKKLQLWRP